MTTGTMNRTLFITLMFRRHHLLLPHRRHLTMRRKTQTTHLRRPRLLPLRTKILLRMTRPPTIPRRTTLRAILHPIPALADLAVTAERDQTRPDLETKKAPLRDNRAGQVHSR